MGLEMFKLSKELWTGFMHHLFNLVESYRNLQAHQSVLHPPPPPPPPQPAQLSAVQLQQQQLAFVCPSSAPPLVSPPSFRQQITQPWQPGTDIQPHQGWALGPNLSGLNTSGLSGVLDPAGQTGGPGTSSTLTTP